MRWVTLKNTLARRGVEYPEGGAEVGYGWVCVVDNVLGRLVNVGWDRKLGQIKSKFCRLVVDLEGETTEKIEAIIVDACRSADKMCENCGLYHGRATPRSGWALCARCSLIEEVQHLDDVGL